MVNGVHLRLNAADRSYFALLKKEVHALAASAGFTPKRLAEIDIIVAEVVSNLAKHTTLGGELFVKLFEEKGVPAFEIIAIDNGPGIRDIRGMMQDGVSTKSTLGQGLGAIKRLSDVFQVYSQAGWGTLLLIRIYKEELSPVRQEKIAVRSFVVPKPGETDCGDGFYVKQTKEHIKLFLGDGLGHGAEASMAVQKAIEAFKICPEHNTVEILRFIHQSVKKTRGLVATVAVFNIKEKQWRICGVGNIATKMYSASGIKTHSPYNGIVGLNMPNTMNEQSITYEPGQTLILCSDGIKSKWDMLKLPAIMRYDLSLLNAALFKDFARNTDDMSIASCKIMI